MDTFGAEKPGTRHSLLELVERAFAQVKRKPGRTPGSMSLAVLKNRLLQITNRKFNPADYGARNFRDLLESLAPDVVVSGLGQETVVQFARPAGKRVPDSPSGAPTPALPQPEASPENPRSSLLANGVHVREDLWMAVVDYTSGRRYVWDESLGRAREAKPNDTQPAFPTLKPDELNRWRAEFLNAHADSLSASDMALAMRWREQGLPTLNLPLSLQHRWKRELTRRVRARLKSFFGFNLRTDSNVPQALQATLVSAPAWALDEEISAARDAGDFFAVGELLARKLKMKPKEGTSVIFASIIAAWTSSRGPALMPESLVDLVSRLDSMSEENAATALVNAMYRVRKEGVDLPGGIGDLAFRLRESVAAVYDIEDRKSPLDTCNAGVAKLEKAISEIEDAVRRFLRTTPATAKFASIEVLKLAHALYPLLVTAERGFLRDLEVLIGPAFRKLCEAHERNDDVQVLRRAPEFQENIKSHTPGSQDPRLFSGLWNGVVAPMLEHLAEVVEDATSRGEAALAPTLELRNRTTKADLRLVDREILLTFALRNSGRGHAHDVSFQSLAPDSPARITLAEPSGPFDVPAGGEQLVRVRVVLSAPLNQMSARVNWICQTALGKQAIFDDAMIVDQQVTEPNWDALVSDPPYSLNPIRRSDRLYGRDSALRKLTLAAMSGASTFVWGQKRIGKTSLLQVLAGKLAERSDTTCILLRMGELVSLHEGEIARLIATRLLERCGSNLQVPPEAEFGAGIGRLIAFSELLSSTMPARKFVVIIDEFDDLDASFYTGERGKQFVKALRSTSEVGLTFFFIGSERMEAIYRRHQADLNKWTNVQLDRIDSRVECKALITTPVANAIEFSLEAADFIIDYCGGNPFYIHNFCYQIFDRCLQEHKTFVDDNDTNAIRHQLLRALGPTNFAHFWEDNPVLEPDERRRAIAENCVALTCMAVLGGRYESTEELLEVQESLPFAAADRASATELRRACERLVARKIFVAIVGSEGFVVSLQIFREWLAENAVAKLLPVWTAYKETERLAACAPASTPPSETDSDYMPFVIPEDDIIAVSQRLVFCGRQKDVADIRSWLRQFDDEARIEVAFLLLKRLSERGFINEGTKSLTLAKLEEMVRARRLEVGDKVWKVERGRLDNLCMTYVDSELKSGAATTRDLRNMMRPGKSGAAAEIGGWMRSHIKDDPMIAVVDDFAGTGETLAKGLKRFKEQIDRATWNAYVDARRISIFVMFAFPEAIENVRQKFPELHVVAATTLGDELRAFSEESTIFDNEAELRFARDVLHQIGRELYPDAPLGFGNLGALFALHNTVPNNTLPIFWSNGRVGERAWNPLFPRA